MSILAWLQTRLKQQSTSGIAITIETLDGKPKVRVTGGQTVAVSLSGAADRWVPLVDGFSYEENSRYKEAPGLATGSDEDGGGRAVERGSGVV